VKGQRAARLELPELEKELTRSDELEWRRQLPVSVQSEARLNSEREACGACMDVGRDPAQAGDVASAGNTTLSFGWPRLSS
jgi:hypothetical protein